jgi:hypothetical protein
VAVSSGLLFTVRVTTNDCGELPAPAEVNVTVSLYVPGARLASTVEFTEMARLCGVVPVVGVTVTKSTPPVVVGAVVTVKAKGVPELAIWTF